jgi:hypothetical protein
MNMQLENALNENEIEENQYVESMPTTFNNTGNMQFM